VIACLVENAQMARWATIGAAAPSRPTRSFARLGSMTDKGRGDRPADRWAELVDAIARSRDKRAFAELFAYFAPRLKAQLMKRGLAASQAEDLAQEAMIAVWRKALQFRAQDGGVATWIFAIARNLRIDALRREARRGGVPASDAEAQFALDDAPSADARMEEAQSEEQVRRAMRSLPEPQLRVVELSFFEERAHPEIARLLNIPLGTVKSRLRLAMNRLRELLGPNR